MKLTSLFVIMAFVPGTAIAQDVAHGDQGTGSRQAADPAMHASMTVPRADSLVELNALFRGPRFSSASDNRLEMKTSPHAEAGIIDAWRERVYKTLGVYSDSGKPDSVKTGRHESNTDLAIEAQERRAVESAVLRETLKFAQERIPEIDRLVKMLSFEISNRPSLKNSVPADHNKKSNEAPRVAGDDGTGSRLLMKTGLRVPIEHGRPGLESRTEVQYGSISSLLTVSLIGRYDNTVGLSYALANDARLEVTRQVTHAADPGMGDPAAASLNLIQVVYKF